MITKIASKLHQQLYQDVQSKIKDQFGWDVSNIPLIVSNTPRFNNGKPHLTMPPEEFGGCHTKDGIVLPTFKHWEKVRKNYGVEHIPPKSFAKIIAGHELGHEVYKNHLTEPEKKRWDSKLKNFSTEYTKYNPRNNTPEERFSEYVARAVST